jgi:hypothetical protein
MSRRFIQFHRLWPLLLKFGKVTDRQISGRNSCIITSAEVVVVSQNAAMITRIYTRDVELVVFSSDFFFAQMISTSFCRWTRHESPLRFFSSRSDRSSYTHMGWRTNHAQLKAGGRIRYHHRLCETIQSASAPLRTKHSWDQPGILRVTTHSLRPDCSVLQQCSGTATQWSTIKYRNKQSYKVE